MISQPSELHFPEASPSHFSIDARPVAKICPFFGRQTSRRRFSIASRAAALSVIAASGLLALSSARAVDVTYTIPDASGDSTTPVPFSGLGLTPSVGDLLQDVTTAAPVGFGVTVDVDVTVGRILLNSGGAHGGTFFGDGTHVFRLDNTGSTTNNIFGDLNASIAQSANSGTLAIGAGVVLTNSNLDVGSTQAGTLTISGPITAATAQTLFLRSDGSGANTISGTIGASGANLAIVNASIGAGAFTLSGSIGQTTDGTSTRVTSITQNSATSQLNLVNAVTTSGALNIAAGTVALQNLATYSFGSLSGAGALTTAVASGGGGLRTLIVGSDNTASTFSGTITEAANRALSLTKVGAGTLTLSGNVSIGNTTGSAGTGGGVVSVNGGTLALDYTAATAPASNIILGGARGTTLVLGGGQLQMIGNAATANTQTFTATTFNAGRDAVTLTGGLGSTLTLGPITRAAGSNVVFTIPAGGVISTTSGTASTLLTGTGGSTASTYATVTDGSGNIVDFAAKDANNANIGAGSALAPALYSSPTGTGNVNEAGATYPTAVLDFANNGVTGIRLSNSTAFVTDGIRFNVNRGGDWTIDTASAGRVLSTGGLLVTANVGAFNVNVSGLGSIRQATLGSDLILTQDNTNGLLNVSAIIATGSSSSATNLVKAGRGTMTLTAVNSYSGQTYLNNGATVITANSGLGGGATPTTLSAVNLNGGALVGNGMVSLTDVNSGLTRPVNIGGGGGGLAATTGNTLTVDGLVAGGTLANPSGPLIIGLGALPGTGAGTANAVALVGDGTVALSNANTYSGSTTVAAGTLLVNGFSSTGSGAVMVNAGATLGGQGSVAGQAIINGTITAGTLGASSVLYLSSGVVFRGSALNPANYAVDLDSNGNDQLTITGVLDLSGANDKITFNGALTGGNSIYTLATYSSILGMFNTVANLPPGYALSYTGTELDLVLAPVPEPSTTLMLGLAAGALLWTQRRSLGRLGGFRTASPLA